MTREKQILEILQSIARQEPQASIYVCLHIAEKIVDAIAVECPKSDTFEQAKAIAENDEYASHAIEEIKSNVTAQGFTPRQIEIISLIQTFHAEGESCVSTQDLAEALEVTPSAVSQQLKALINSDVIERVTVKTDYGHKRGYRFRKIIVTGAT